MEEKISKVEFGRNRGIEVSPDAAYTIFDPESSSWADAEQFIEIVKKKVKEFKNGSVFPYGIFSYRVKIQWKTAD